MQELIAGLANGGVKRLLIPLLAVGLIAFNKKLGLEMTEIQMGAIASIIIAWVTQSGLNAAKQKGLDAAAAIKTPEDAATVVTAIVPAQPAPTMTVEEALKLFEDTMKKLKPVLIFVLCVGMVYGSPAFAEDYATDSPTRGPTVLKVGESIPYDGVCQDNPGFVLTAQRLAQLDAENAALKRGNIHWAVVVGLAVGLVVTAGFAGYGIAKATQRSVP